MDALSVLNHLSNVLTVEEWQAFKETEDYLWMMARVEGYKGAHMQQLIDAGKRRRSEAWEIALDMARNVVSIESEELPIALSDDAKERLIVHSAERLLMDQNLTPPTFTAWTDCATCGRVPVPANTPSETPHCAWCLHDS
jgi:hypothetical protein